MFFQLLPAKGGTPPLIPVDLKAAILAYEGPGGLRNCLNAFRDKRLDVAVADKGVLVDMDSPGDYAAIQERFASIELPSLEEAMALLAICQANHMSAMAHARTVATVAATIGRALNRAGNNLNLRLIEAAGMLHDIAKGQPNHAQKGVEWISASGFKAVADVVGKHMDLVFDRIKGVKEAEVVYLADKMVSGSVVVPLERRLQWKKEQFSDDPDALKNMVFRMEQAIRIRNAIEDLTGKPIEDLNHI